VPKLAFPGGALIGCSAGFVNVPRIKGSHNAMLSGMLAAEAWRRRSPPAARNDTLDGLRGGWRAARSARISRRCATSSRSGRNSAPSRRRLRRPRHVDQHSSSALALRHAGHGKPDYATLEPAAKHKKIDYPKPDGVLTFDRLSSVFLSNTNHEEDQPVHLKLKDEALQKSSELDVYAGPSAAIARPASMNGWKPTARRTFVPDQRAELRPLQDLRHQGSQPEHQLGPAAGRRGTGLYEHVEARWRRNPSVRRHHTCPQEVLLRPRLRC
jgi:electron-transferring-flavoprotein dehydrogenase